ncbi:hypothetical protein OSH08_05190 [Kaistia geumhonensis]|uniref:Uncharacterized protein n=1 Tax=Kaistia geumhonensis TaxID=410839 RepID=A0ABU0M618_9HYPH|nr:hypothetical protein [Kaistia geumhonensis]MCX5478387.1 hypothetical protein [Kaistia geumhonensis]MDQ0516395.1 hypothetical protein [Kaistia geumhonensis]
MARDDTIPAKGPLMNAARYDVTEKQAGEPPRYPVVPPVDERANAKFLDSLVDTDGRPMSEARPVIEREGMDDDEDEDER